MFNFAVIMSQKWHKRREAPNFKTINLGIMREMASILLLFEKKTT